MVLFIEWIELYLQKEVTAPFNCVHPVFISSVFNYCIFLRKSEIASLFETLKLFEKYILQPINCLIVLNIEHSYKYHIINSYHIKDFNTK